MALTVKPITRNDTRKENAIREVRAGPNVKLTVNISKSLRAKFKIATIHNNTDMSEVILNCIEEYIK